jgi:hypothetical protein
MTTYPTHAESAAEQRRTAQRYYGQARRDAKRAAGAYRTARSIEQHAAWLTARPDMVTAEYTPAGLAAEASTWVRIGDTYLRASFDKTDHARFYGELARRYDAMARPATV